MDTEQCYVISLGFSIVQAHKYNTEETFSFKLNKRTIFIIYV